MTPTPRSAFAFAAAVLLTAGTILGLVGHSPADPPSPLRPPAAEADLAPPGATRIGTAQFRQVGWHKRVFFAADGKTLIVTGGGGGAVRFWDVEAGKLVYELTLPTRDLHGDAALAPDAGLLAVIGTHWPNGNDGGSEVAVALVDTAGRKVVRVLRMPDKTRATGQAVRVTADGKRVFTAVDGDIRVWDARTGDELIRHKGRVGSDAFSVSPDGKLIAFGRYDVYLWRWETGEEPKKFTAVGGFGTELIEFAPDGKTLLVAPLSGGLLTTYDVATGRLTGSTPLRAPPGILAFSPDGKTLAVSLRETADRNREDHAVGFWDPAAGKELRRLPVGRAAAEHLSWSKDGSRLAAVSDYRAWAWDVKTGQVLGPRKPGHEGSIGALGFGPDGTLFTASDDGTVRSWNPVTGQSKLELGHDYWVRDVAISPDGALVAGSALRNDLRIWDAKTGKQRFRLLGNGMMGGKRRVRFTPNGTRLIAWGDDDYLRVWDVRNGKLLAEHSTRPAGEKIDEDDPFADRLRMMRSLRDAADISPDGSALALGEGAAVRLIDPLTGKERQKLTVGDTFVMGVVFSPDGKRLAVACRGKPVQTKLPDGRTRHSTEKELPVAVWDLADGKPVWTAAVEGSWPALAYSPDGKRVAVVAHGQDLPNVVQVRDAATGKEAGRIELPRRGGHVAFDRTGKRLAVAFDDTTAMVYDLETALKPAAPK